MRNSMNTSALETEPLSRDSFALRTHVAFSEVGERWAENSPENEGPTGTFDAVRAPLNSLASREGIDPSPLGYALYNQARTKRAAALAAMIAATYDAVREMARRANERRRQRRHARITYDTLSHLDDHTLRDLGFDRLEISSLAAEASGRVESTRIRTLRALEEQR